MMYNDVQEGIDELTDGEPEVQYREKFEEEYFSLVAQAESLLTRGVAIG